MELSPQQPGSATAIAAIVPPVTPVVAPVLPAVAAIIAPVRASFVTPAKQARSISSISGRSHLHAPFIAAWRSASTAAMSA